MITNKGEPKEMTEHISCHFKCKFNRKTCNSNKKWNNKTCQCECKNYRKCKRNSSWNASTCISENSKYLKSVADTSVTKCDKIVFVMDISATIKTKTIAINVTSTAYHSKKVRNCYILYSILSANIFLLIITIICDHYAKQKGIVWNRKQWI